MRGLESLTGAGGGAEEDSRDDGVGQRTEEGTLWLERSGVGRVVIVSGGTGHGVKMIPVERAAAPNQSCSTTAAVGLHVVRDEEVWRVTAPNQSCSTTARLEAGGWLGCFYS